MSATITWTDSVGAATLSNIPEIPVDRFDGWTPDVNSVGDEAIALGTGQLYKFEYRVDDLVSFRIDNLKGDQLTYARRLKLHLLRGGEVTVSATNELNELFTTCTLAPDTRPVISEPNREREYSFSVTLRAGEGVPDETTEGSALDEFGIVPGLILDWDAEAMVLAGHVNNEALPIVTDQSGEGNNGFQAGSLKPILKTAQVNSKAAFDLTGSKACTTSAALLTPTDDCTVFSVFKHTGAHVEHGVSWKFCTAGTFDPTAFAVKQSHHVYPGGAVDDTFQIGDYGYMIDQPSTDWYVLATRFTGTTMEMFYNEALQEIFIANTGVSVGTAIVYGGGAAVNDPCWFVMGNGLTSGGNALNGLAARKLVFERALSDTEIVAVSSHLRVLYGL